MVETNNNYKTHKRYNRHGRFNKYRNNPTVKRGILNFLFSFDGKISKNLFTGFSVVFLTLFTIMHIIMLFLPRENNAVQYSYLTLYMIIGIMAITLGYKRAHSLGISGWYSCFGTGLFRPFFCFYRPDRDFANDEMYKNKFERIKKIGAFFDKNRFTQILYICLFPAISIVPIIFDKEFLSDIPHGYITFIASIFCFNILQLFVIDRKWIKKSYATIVKVISFIAYNEIIYQIAYIIASFEILVKLFQQAQ